MTLVFHKVAANCQCYNAHMRQLKKYKNIAFLIVIVAVFVWQLGSQYAFKNNQHTAAETQNSLLRQLYQQQQSDRFLTVSGKVYRLLPDDTKGSQHQRFLIDVDGISVLVAHNIDLASKVPLSVGDQITLHGEYEYNDKGGVLHWTHHDPKGWRQGGWINHQGKLYR